MWNCANKHKSLGELKKKYIQAQEVELSTGIFISTTGEGLRVFVYTKTGSLLHIHSLLSCYASRFMKEFLIYFWSGFFLSTFRGIFSTITSEYINTKNGGRKCRHHMCQKNLIKFKSGFLDSKRL